MRDSRGYRVPVSALLALILAGCVGTPQRPQPAPPPRQPPDVTAVPDPVPRAEPRSALGNPPFYDVLGKRYFVLGTAEGYLERGVASWYGPGFHAEKTSNGEPYDMYGMTAAHKTLPLPAFVRVTNLRNGKTVVVRVNDRGPFKDGRIIDLSYTAAAKLDMLKDGTALVEVQALTQGGDNRAAATTPASRLYVQAGAFGEEANAVRLVARLKAEGYDTAFVRQDAANGRALFRVRIGPVPTVEEFDRAVAQLKKLGLDDARLAAE
ncbi:MAG: septal ring lytic transglycosylase RlpA family protein [Steroidobacteraceae bacterium]